jgi:hypothetical protein
LFLAIDVAPVICLAAANRWWDLMHRLCHQGDNPSGRRISRRPLGISAAPVIGYVEGVASGVPQTTFWMPVSMFSVTDVAMTSGVPLVMISGLAAGLASGLAPGDA